MRGDAKVVVVSGPRGLNAIADNSPTAGQSSTLEVVVLFSGALPTLAALRMAGQLGQNLDVRVKLVTFQTVPYELELTRPTIATRWIEERLCALASKAPVEVRVDIILCRDPGWALRQVLKPDSLVVIGTRRRWWRTQGQRLAGRLRQDGHQVILAYVQ
jgi:hypothetical protein